MPRLTGAPSPPRGNMPSLQRKRQLRSNGPAKNSLDLSIEDALAEIAARQRALDGNAAIRPVPDAPGIAPLPETSSPLSPESPASTDTGRATDGTVAVEKLNLATLEEHLRQITSRIDALRPAKDLETAIAAVRDDLTEIGLMLTEALPRRAVESLEIEVKALGQRIDHSRELGVEFDRARRARERLG